MRNIYYLLLFVFILLNSHVFAQDTKFGIKGGLNLAVINNTINLGAEIKPGFHGGIYMESKISDFFALQPELLYSSQGCKVTTYTGQENGQIDLQYATFGLHSKFYLIKGLNITLGPQAGLLLSAKETYKIGPTGNSATVDARDRYQNVDLSLCAGLGYQLEQGFNIGMRYSSGLSNIESSQTMTEMRKRMGIGLMTNRVIQFSAGYSF